MSHILYQTFVFLSCVIGTCSVCMVLRSFYLSWQEKRRQKLFSSYKLGRKPAK